MATTSLLRTWTTLSGPITVTLTQAHIDQLSFLFAELTRVSRTVIDQERQLHDARAELDKKFGIVLLESETVRDGIAKAKDKIDGKQPTKPRKILP